MTIITDSFGLKEKELRIFIAIMLEHPFIFSNERKYRIRRHLAFWLFWWIFQGFLYSFLAVVKDRSYFWQLRVSMMDSFFFMVNHMFLSYSLMYFVIPRFLLKQRYWQTAGITIIIFLVTAAISGTIGVFLLPELRSYIFNIDSESYRTTSSNFFQALMAGLRGGITIGGIAAAIKLMKFWYVKEQRNLQLQKENIASQLQLLKAQVHPHFLFNTLNNIYSFTQNSSPAAAKMVSGLSDLLRYMLYDGSHPLVPLHKELTMVKDYIELEKIRYGNKLELHLAIPADTKDLQIAPLLLLPLVENCFKHGASHILEHPWINLQIDIVNQQMRMKLINGKIGTSPSSSSHNGIGIKNVQKRLSLLYPGKHEFSITNEEDVFIVSMKINLEGKKTYKLKPIPHSAIHYA